MIQLTNETRIIVDKHNLGLTRGAIAVCRVFNVEVEDFDVLVRTK